ncbi:MAG TPA: pyridoxamine 5'-phosphate oxidase family protein [Chloroflexia bacterium]|nr:pyridoxamine 5'-phosphate oxidase family protein [Chloroflexia bacterium]
MAEREPVAEQLATPNAPTITSMIAPWAEIRDKLVEGGTTWLTTVRPDGRPHVVPVGALWIDGAYYVTTGQGTVKGNNLDHDPHCVITLSSGGFDMVVEGEAAKVSDVEKLERVARVYANQGWPAYVHDGVLDAPYSAATTGPAPYDVYEVAPSVAFAFGTGEETVNRSTRYRF